MLLLTSLLGGCGGGGGGGGTASSLGRVAVRLTWPGRSRYIPPYANSVVCTLQINGGGTLTMTVNRSGDQGSTVTATFPDDVPIGSHLLTVTAYPELNGGGQAVATENSIVAVNPGHTTTTDVTADLQSTIDHMVIDGQPLSVVSGGTLTLAAHGVDATDHIILLAPGSIVWDVVGGGSYGSVNATSGVFTATAVGSVTVRARETGAGKSVTAQVSVTNLTGDGGIAVRVDWPGRSRYVPPYANSLVCQVAVDGEGTYTLTMNRVGDSQTTGTGTFTQTFAPGTYPLTVKAMSAADGAGEIVATTSMNVTVAAGQVTTKNVTANLQSTIDHVVIDGQPLSATVPNTLTIHGHAEDSSNATILLPQGALKWDVTEGTSYGTINAVTGVFTAEYAGTATVRLREVGASKAVTASVTVSGSSQPQKIYVLDASNSRIAVMDSISGAGWQTFGVPSSWSTSIAVDSLGRIYWADEYSNCIRRCDASGGNPASFGATGEGEGQFQDPVGVAIDGSNRIYIADKFNNRVVRIDDMSGTGWVEVGGFGEGDGRLYIPEGVTIASNGDIYVADTGHCRIVRFRDMAASGWDIFGEDRGSDVGQFDTPTAITVTSAGIFVVDQGNNRIVRITDMSGSGWASLGGPSVGSGTGQFNLPTGISCDLSGRVYVSDCNNNRIVRFDDIAGTNWTAYGTIGSGSGQFVWPKGIVVR